MKFVILCYPRTGSTLLITALGMHRGVRQGMEIFNPALEGEAPYVAWRKREMESLYGPQESYLDAIGYLDEARFDLSRLSRRFFEDFDGTKIMYDQVGLHSPVWEHVRSIPDLRVIVLRRNIVAAAVSFRLALDTNVWHVPAQEPAPEMPSLVFDPGFFGWFHDHFCAREAEITARFRPEQRIDVDYEVMTSAWDGTLSVVERHLGLLPSHGRMPFRKQTRGRITELVSNFEEVAAHYREHPVLARHFAAARGPEG